MIKLLVALIGLSLLASGFVQAAFLLKLVTNGQADRAITGLFACALGFAVVLMLVWRAPRT
ncbi:MAG: hypothetical protein JWQ36_1967 [Enterovirga sp.]|jgi:hypothetical protein|nr:hypothetical protein [Enterovirga sp.]